MVSERRNNMKQYQSLLVGLTPAKYNAQVAQLNPALGKKVVRDGLTLAQASFGAGLGAMLSWFQAGLLLTPEVTVQLGNRLSSFLESFASASALGGQTQVQQTFILLGEAGWLAGWLAGSRKKNSKGMVPPNHLSLRAGLLRCQDLLWLCRLWITRKSRLVHRQRLITQDSTVPVLVSHAHLPQLLKKQHAHVWHDCSSCHTPSCHPPPQDAQNFHSDKEGFASEAHKRTQQQPTRRPGKTQPLYCNILQRRALLSQQLPCGDPHLPTVQCLQHVTAFLYNFGCQATLRPMCPSTPAHIYCGWSCPPRRTKPF